MRILLLNRRDTANPQGGGAEIYTLEICKSFVNKGHEVTIFTSAFKNAQQEQIISGVRHIRKGGELSVHLYGFLYAMKHRSEYDLIIDEYNGLGFFSFMLSGKTLLLIHQLYREFWFRELGMAGFVPYIIEPVLLRFYRKRPAVTISESTRSDLLSLGFRDVSIVKIALSNAKLETLPEKEDVPTMLFLGRLRSTKKPEHSILVHDIVKKAIPNIRLWIVGRGPDEKKLKEMASGDGEIKFFGFVREDEKFDLIRRAHLLFVPGVREGFGINVIEAASQGTPSVGYDVPGLRDSIRNGSTGLLATGPEDAAEKIIHLLRHEKDYERMALECLRYVDEFTWENKAGEFIAVVERVMKQPGA